MTFSTILERDDGTGYIAVFLAQDSEAVAAGNGFNAYDSTHPDYNEHIQVRNGFAHTHKSAEILYSYGRTVAETLGNWKEATPTTIDSRDEYRDQFNNELGRKLAEYLNTWIDDEAQQGRTYTNAEQEGFLDDLVYDAYVSGAMIWDLVNDPRVINFSSQGTTYQNPSGDVTWTQPTANWKDSSAARDYSNVDDFSENPIGFTLNLPVEAGRLLDNTYNSIEELISDVYDATVDGFNQVSTWFDNTLDWFGVELTGWWDPLVIDVDGDGIAADYKPPVWNGTNNVYETHFDLDGDGFAQAVAWHGDGFLVRDLNSNGRIDNGTEMFGDATTDGFTALAAFDGNSDGVIDASDAIWSDLQIWEDANADGQTQSGELLSLSSLDITGINLTSTFVQGGTGLTHTGSATTSTGTLEAGNYNFQMEAANTRYAQDYTFDLRAAFLPTMRGYNQMADLHIAISLDNDETDPNSLISLATDIASYSFTDLFENFGTVNDKIENLLFKWAGVDGVAANSRGDFISDARQLEFVEQYLGQGFVDQNQWGTNPGAVQAREFQEFWDTNIFPQLKGAYLSQTVGSEFFVNDTYSYDAAQGAGVHDQNSFAFSQDALDELEAAAIALPDTQERLDFWLNVADFINALPFMFVDENNAFYPAEFAKLATAIANSDSDLVWDSSNHDPANGVTSVEYRFLNPLGETIEGDANANDHLVDTEFGGTANADTIIGNGAADILAGAEGDDVIYGHNEDGTGDDGASDTLLGQAGDDELYGGAGNDTLNGGAGNDHLIGGDGNDLLQDGSAAGQIGVTQNLLEGGAGDDDYSIVAGGTSTENFIVDTSGYDEVILGNNSTFFIEYATFRRFLDTDLEILGGDGPAGSLGYNIFVADQFTALGDSNGAGVERIRFQESAPGSQTQDNWVDLKSYLTNYTGVIETRGSDQDDVINGILTGSEDDLIYAYGGDDTLSGDAGDDTIHGGDGDDIINGGVGDDNLHGDAGFNIIHGGNGIDNITNLDGESYGEAGNDTMLGGGLLDGGDGDDTINGNDTDDLLIGGNGNDTLKSSNGNDEVQGGAGNDTIESGNGINHLYGGAGDDTVTSKATVFGSQAHMHYESGIDVFTGAIRSIDTIYFDDGSDLSDWNISLNGNDLIMVKDAGVNEITIKDSYIDKLVFSDGFEINFAIDQPPAWVFGTNGGNGGDVIIGTDNADTLNGLGNTDIIHGRSGDDTLDGGVSADDIHGGHGDDTLIGGSGNDRLWGGSGVDTASFANAAGAVIVNLGTGTATGEGTDALFTIENVIGSSYNDTITGDNNDNVLAGGAGDDTLDGGLGSDTADYSGNIAAVNVELNNDQTDEGRDSSWDDDLTSIENVIGSSYADRIIGDDEDNTVHAGDSTDMVYGGVGSDSLHGEDGNDALYGEHGDDVLYGGAGADTLDGDRYNLSANDSGNDTIYGGEGADNIWGRHGDDVLHGENGNDILRGNEGNDTLFGGAGNDKLYGHDGDDILWGGLDHDDLWGGAGADTFAFASTLIFDEIHDFSLTEGDKLDISSIVTGFNPGTSVLTDFFKIGFNGTHSYAHVDSDGGADGFDQIIKFVNTQVDETDFTVGVNLII